MSIHVTWDDPEQTAIRLTFSPQWTWRELDNGFSRANAWIEAAGHPVDLIFDARETVMMPDSALTHIRDALSRIHPHTRMIVVVVGPSAQITRFGRTLVNFLQRFFWLHHPIIYTPTLEEARAILQGRARIS